MINKKLMQIRPIIYPGAIILGFFVCMISSCGSESPNPMVPEEEMNQDTVIFMSREWMGALDSNIIDEASGLASSISYPNSFWTHNDSGDGPYLYLINEPFTQMVGGDISAQGDQIVLKNYTTVYYWKRKPGQSITEALASKPFLTPYIQEPQGEAIAWSRDGNAFYTLSEKGPFNIKPALYRYQKRP